MTLQLIFRSATRAASTRRAPAGRARGCAAAQRSRRAAATWVALGDGPTDARGRSPPIFAFRGNIFDLRATRETWPLQTHFAGLRFCERILPHRDARHRFRPSRRQARSRKPGAPLAKSGTFPEIPGRNAHLFIPFVSRGPAHKDDAPETQASDLGFCLYRWRSADLRSGKVPDFATAAAPKRAWTPPPAPARPQAAPHPPRPPAARPRVARRHSRAACARNLHQSKICGGFVSRPTGGRRMARGRWTKMSIDLTCRPFRSPRPDARTGGACRLGRPRARPAPARKRSSLVRDGRLPRCYHSHQYRSYSRSSSTTE